jgi:uncharacterized protein
MCTSTPFIKKFKTDAYSYVYNVNTNQILRVDDTIYDILDDYGKLSVDELIEKHYEKWGVDLLRQKLAAIDEAKSNGLFSHCRPTSIEYPENHEVAIKMALDSQLGQVVLDVTESCNMRCRYCFYSGHYQYVRTHSPRVMSFETARKAIDFYCSRAEKEKDLTISFYGGEPLIGFNKVIKPCVEYIKQNWPDRSVIFALTTNGTLLTDRIIIPFLIEHNFRLSISLDGPQSIHDNYRVLRTQKGSFERIIRNLTKLKNHDREYFNKMVSFLGVAAPPYDLKEVSDFYSSFDLIEDSFSPRQLRYGFMNILDTDLLQNFDQKDSKSQDSIKFLWGQYLKYVTEGKPFAREIWLAKALFDDTFSMIHNRLMSSLPERCYPNGICLPGKRKLFVDCDGNFYMCERVGYAFCIGNVVDGFDVKKISNLIAEYCEMSTNDCCDCWAIRLCDACFLRAQKGSALDVSRKRESCAVHRKKMEWFLGNYCRILETNPNALDFLRET